MGGLVHRNKSLAIHLFILTLGAIGLPLTNGFVGEFMLLYSLSQVHILLALLAGMTIILGAVYMLRMYQKSIFGKGAGADKFQLNATENLILLGLSASVILLGVFPQLIFWLIPNIT